jgi:hypothetical protein
MRGQTANFGNQGKQIAEEIIKKTETSFNDVILSSGNDT